MKKSLIQIMISAAVLGLAGHATAATGDAKSMYKAVEDQAAATYKADHAKCDSLSGNPKDVCVAEAKAARVHTEAEAKATYKNTVSARTTARKDIAAADYKVAKEKCEAQTGNAKDVCIKEAKSAETAAKSDAKADKKVVEARTDARDDKMTAEYKVATEKCDAMTGKAKDSCVASAKAKYGK